MRTAEDIVNEYRRRKYDTFRIRAIAALRPEPMRSQILALLDAEETAEAVFAEAGVEDLVEAPVSASLDIISDVMAEEIEVGEEFETANNSSPEDDSIAKITAAAPEEAAATAAEEEPEVVMTASSTLFSSMSAAPRARELTARARRGLQPDLAGGFAETESDTEMAEAAAENTGDSLGAEMVTEDELVADDILMAEGKGEDDLFAVIAAAEAENEPSLTGKADPDGEKASPAPQVMGKLPDSAISMEDDATAYLEEKADNKILFMFHDGGKASASDLAKAEMHLVEKDKEENEWYDYGSGLIVVPKSMHEVQAAYAQALRGQGDDHEDKLPETSLDELVEAFAREEFEEEEVTSGEEWQLPAATQAALTENSEKDLAREIAELENSIANIEKRLREAQEESDKRSQMLVEAENLVALQQSQLEEARCEVAQRDAAIRELESSLDGMHEFNSKAVLQQAQAIDLERERNILKTEVVPALEDQQLALVDMLEEETRAHAASKKQLRGLRRRTLVGYGAAMVACLFAVSLAMLNPAALPGRQNPGTGNLQLVQTPTGELVAQQEEQLAALTRENEVLRAAFSQKEAEWKHTEGSLRRLIAVREQELARRHNELRNKLTAMQSERDRTLQQYALAPIRQKSSPESLPPTGKVTVPVAAVSPTPARAATYKVKPGDDLGTIYKKHFGGPIKWPLVRKIAEKNGLSSPNDIHPGQVLNLAMAEVE